MSGFKRHDLWTLPPALRAEQIFARQECYRRLSQGDECLPAVAAALSHLAVIPSVSRSHAFQALLNT